MPGKFSHPALGGCPARRRGQAKERSAPLVQSWPSLTRGCCYLLGPKVWLPGAAGEGVGPGAGGARPGCHGLPKAAEHRRRLAVGCKCVGLVLGGCLGEPVAVLGGMLQHWGWASSAEEACTLTDRLPQVPACPALGGGAAGRSHPAPRGKVLSGSIGHYTKSKTLNERLFHGPNLLLSSLLETILLEKSRLAGGSPTTSSTEPEGGMSKPGKSSLGQPGCSLHWHPQFELSYNSRGSVLSCRH